MSNIKLYRLKHNIYVELNFLFSDKFVVVRWLHKIWMVIQTILFILLIFINSALIGKYI